MTTNQILIGVGLILVLAAGAQVLASRLRIPAIIVLLQAGFIAGALTSDVNPERRAGLPAVISSTYKGAGSQLGQFAVSVAGVVARGIIGTALYGAAQQARPANARHHAQIGW